jgi:hypothetical protein
MSAFEKRRDVLYIRAPGAPAVRRQEEGIAVVGVGKEWAGLRF